MQKTSKDCKPITGFDGYFISRTGKVWSRWAIKRLGGRRGAVAVLTDNWHLIKLQTVFCGRSGSKIPYQYVGLCLEGKQIKKRLHRLVAEAFLPNPKHYPIVCHKDSNSLNNAVENLYWGSQKNNMFDRKQRGLYGKNKGEKNGAAKLNTKMVRDIIKMLPNYMDKDIAKQYLVHRRTITDIRLGNTWKHLIVNQCSI